MKPANAFAEEGFFVFHKIFDPAAFAQVPDSLELVHRNFSELKAIHPTLHKLGEWSIKSPHVASKAIRDFLFSTHHQMICEELISGDVDLYWNATAAKPATKGKSFPWHQDSGYGEGPKNYITCWAAFDHVDEGNGCLWTVPGSHRGELFPHELRKSTEDDYAGVFVKEIHFDEKRAVPIRLEPGDIVCMDSRLLHCSYKNNSSRKRRGLISAFIRSGDYQLGFVEGVPEALEPFVRNGRICGL